MPELIDKHATYKALKHEAETHELPASREAYERAARIIDQMKPIGAKSAPPKKGKWLEVTMEVGEFHSDVRGTVEITIVTGKCSECGCYAYNLMQYSPQMPALCPNCGAKNGMR